MLEAARNHPCRSLPVPVVQAIIDGRLCGAASGKTFPVISPIDGATIAAIPDCEARDVDRAVAGARRAFEARHWQGLSPKQRKRIVLRWADRIAAESLQKRSRLPTARNMVSGLRSGRATSTM